jgi:hypothetical protein
MNSLISNGVPFDFAQGTPFIDFLGFHCVLKRTVLGFDRLEFGIDRLKLKQLLIEESYAEQLKPSSEAVPFDAYTSFFATQLAQGIINSQQLKLIVYKPEQEVIEQWLI